MIDALLHLIRRKEFLEKTEEKMLKELDKKKMKIMTLTLMLIKNMIFL